MEPIWSVFLKLWGKLPRTETYPKEEKDMEVQELNKRERLARLDAYFSALKEEILSEPKNDSEEENDETA